MNVPKDCADMGGDIGPGDMGDIGVRGGELGLDDCRSGERRAEKRWARKPGDIGSGVLGIPWTERGSKSFLRRLPRLDVDDKFDFDFVGCGRVDTDINEESIAKSISSIARNVGAGILKREVETEDETPSGAGQDLGHSVNIPGVVVDIVNKAGKRKETGGSQLQ
jgi:hypothetical protein